MIFGNSSYAWFWASHDKISVLCIEGSFKHDAHDVLILPTCTRERGQTDYSFKRMKFTLFIQYFRNSFVTATEIFMEYYCYYYCYTNKSFFFFNPQGVCQIKHAKLSACLIYLIFMPDTLPDTTPEGFVFPFNIKTGILCLLGNYYH